MEKQSKVTVKGTGQLNGPKVINKTVIMDSSMANEFTGSKRYEVIEAFVNTHYPGVKINPKNFGANVVPIKSSEKTTSSKSNITSKSSSSKSSSSKADSVGIGTAGVLGAIGGFLLNGNEDEEDDKEFDLKKEKERLDFEYYKKQKEIEFNNQQILSKNTLTKTLKEEKINSAINDLNNGGNKFVYYFRRLWIYLDKWWKKALFIYFILLIIVMIGEKLGF